MNSTKQKVHVGCQYSKACLKQPLKKRQTKILITNGSLMKPLYKVYALTDLEVSVFCSLVKLLKYCQIKCVCYTGPKTQEGEDCI